MGFTKTNLHSLLILIEISEAFFFFIVFSYPSVQKKKKKVRMALHSIAQPEILTDVFLKRMNQKKTLTF